MIPLPCYYRDVLIGNIIFKTFFMLCLFTCAISSHVLIKYFSINSNRVAQLVEKTGYHLETFNFLIMEVLLLEVLDNITKFNHISIVLMCLQWTIFFIENGVLIRERLKNLLEKKTTTQNHEDFSGINDEVLLLKVVENVTKFNLVSIMLVCLQWTI